MQILDGRPEQMAGPTMTKGDGKEDNGSLEPPQIVLAAGVQRRHGKARRETVN